MSNDTKDLARTKIQKVFSYIREITKLRTPPVANVDSYDWSLRFSTLPKYPTIQTAVIPENEDDFDGVVLRVKRPKETSCPPVPQILIHWIENGWEKIDGEVKHIAARNFKDKENLVKTERFEEDQVRVSEFNVWTEKRLAWQEAERPVREASEVFTNLFKLQAQLQRESEKYQLYLGDGHLVWESALGAVNHPILLKKVELDFDPAIPEFTLRETDDAPELYTTLLRHHELDGSGILASKKQLEDTEPHPLANKRTEDFLKFFIQRFFSTGSFYKSPNEIDKAHPAIYRDPIIFIGSRAQGFAEALDKLIDAMPTAEGIPEALYRIVGVEEKSSVSAGLSLGESSAEGISVPEVPIDFLLTKPANREQERVLTRLENTGSVLVQGPPGTGKSHTIANIIGHLLANGKTVLVTSHTSKALRVVREKVVKPLQPLCVSVLENDTESKSQLEESINGIVSYLSRTDSDSLTREIDQLGSRREMLKKQIEKLEIKALEIRKGEYTDIVVDGHGTPPAEAARKVSELESQFGWIPGPVAYGAPFPLSEVELQELYGSNLTLPIEDEKCIAEELPDLENVLKPTELQEISATLSSLDKNVANRFSELWDNNNQNPEYLEQISRNLSKTLEIFSANQWIHKVVEDSKLGPERLKPWLTLMQEIESTTRDVAVHSELIFKFGPQLGISISIETHKTCFEIINHLESGKSLGFFSTAFNTQWKSFIAGCRVDEGNPTRLEHFKALLAAIETAKLRTDLVRRWERQVVSLGGPALKKPEPEVHAKSFLDSLKLASNWTNTSWQVVESELLRQGFNIKAAQEKVSVNGQNNGYIEQFQRLVKEVLIPAIEARRIWLRLRELESLKEKTLQVLRVGGGKPNNFGDYLAKLGNAVERLNCEEYESSFNRYLDLRSKVQIYQKRISLLKKLGKSAEGLAKSIEMRSGVHCSGLVPANYILAWSICQWRQELERRINEDYSLVQRDLQRLKTELNGVNAQYVEKLAWRFQHQRTGLHERQALTGWQQLQNRITRTGRGVRDAHVKREARKTLKNCKNAVPVWIMPLSRVFDSFDLVQTKFDVILIDEASQSDISALAAFAIAKQVIVVGDKEQVTPYAVGQELTKVQSLIDELLQGIPNRMLYDGKTSVYHLAEQAFGGTIRLVEHFRCVPNIIEFSNQLSYGGEIRPLRESSSSPFDNHLIAHRVDGATSLNKVNQKEALEVASIIAAMIETPEYERSSIGVISMVGQEQAIAIESLLQRRIPTSEYSKFNILCGNASQFQGDERDIIIISMVDSCDNPPLSIRQSEDFKKIFNVAASRARNQLWVVHSLNPSTDLKPGDLRLRLIKHAENPNELKQLIAKTQKKADPKSVVFEPMVIKDLIQNGYRVTPQFEVGAYTIDMVVEGAQKRVAIECDGDRYHPPEKLADDIQRQMVLERLGWVFIRIRGSEYFRYKETTMRRVFAELEELGIEKLGPVESSTSVDKPDELRRKVLQRAFEIRQDWESKGDEQSELKVKRKGWGKKDNKTSEDETAQELATEKNTKPSASINTIVSDETNAYQNDLSHSTDWKSSVVGIDPKQIIKFLQSHGFQVVDKRPAGGSLWVIDDPRFKDLASALGPVGFLFLFAENGSGSTNNTPAWYTKRH